MKNFQSNKFVIFCLQLKIELARLEELKRQHMQKFVMNLRKELDALWDKCYFSAERRGDFAPYYQGKLHQLRLYS